MKRILIIIIELVIGANLLAQNCKEGSNDNIVKGNTYNTEYVYLLRGTASNLDTKRIDILTYYFNNLNDCRQKRDREQGGLLLRIVCDCEKILNPRSNQPSSTFENNDTSSNINKPDEIDKKNSLRNYFTPGEVTVVVSSAIKDALSNDISKVPIPIPKNRKKLSGNELAAGNDFGFGSPDENFAHNESVIANNAKSIADAKFKQYQTREAIKSNKTKRENWRKQRTAQREKLMSIFKNSKDPNEIKNIKDETLRQYEDNIKAGQEMIDTIQKDLLADKTITPEERKELQDVINETTKQLAEEEKELEEIRKMEPSQEINIE